MLCITTDNLQWQNELRCAPYELSAKELRLQELALEYHARAEAYDRTVCTGPVVRGAVMPNTYEELRLINHHASDLRDRLGAQAGTLGFTRMEWQRAIGLAAHDWERQWDMLCALREYEQEQLTNTKEEHD